MDGVRSAQRLCSRFAQADVANFALLDEPRHRTDGVFDGNFWIDAMEVVKIEVIRLEPAQRILTSPSGILRLALHFSPFGPRLAAQVAELGGQHNLAASPLQHLG